MGWHAADTPGWGAEGDRPGDVRRRYGDAGTARRQDPALAATAHARIRSINTAKAAALPGVKAVVVAKDFPDQKFEYIGPERVAVISGMSPPQHHGAREGPL